MSYLWEGGGGEALVGRKGYGLGRSHCQHESYQLHVPDNDLVGRKGYGLGRSHFQHVSYQLHVPDNDLVEENSFFAKFYE